MTREQELFLIEAAINKGRLTVLPELTPEEATERLTIVIKKKTARQKSQEKNDKHWARTKRINKEKKECPCCHTLFLPKRKDTVYCGDICRFKVKYEKTKERQQGAEL